MQDRPVAEEAPVEVSSGGVVVRRGPGGLEVALAEQQDRHTGQRTVRLPKGRIAPGETPEAAAVREVLEETGLRAQILRRLRDVRYGYFHTRQRRHVAKCVHFFLMRHTGGRPEPRDAEMDRAYWCELARAGERLTFETERRVVAEAWDTLESPGGPRL